MDFLFAACSVQTITFLLITIAAAFNLGNGADLCGTSMNTRGFWSSFFYQLFVIKFYLRFTDCGEVYPNANQYSAG